MSNRVYDYAKKFAQDTTTFIKKLTKLGIENKTALNKLSEEEIRIIEENKDKIEEKVENVVIEKMIFKNDSMRKTTNQKNNNNNNNFNNNKIVKKKWDNNQNKTDDKAKKDFKKKWDNNDNNKKDKPVEKRDFSNKTVKKEETTEAPSEQVSKKSKAKPKFDKKKYENEKKAKEERKLKELRTDYRKEESKKKVKKKDKTVKSEIVKIDEESGMLKISSELSVKELAEKLGVNVSDIIKKFFMEGKMITANAILSMEEIEQVALEYNVLIEVEEQEELSYGQKYNLEIEDKDEDLCERAPVITIMGHVDHGKTSLLDALRHTNVIEGEAGGITQKIGAYQVEYSGKKITFIDTPGHEAFTEMRARGANITDIAILIVAADDGVKPQTVEAISHAKEANVPIIVAINKIDKPGANPMKVKQELTEYGLVCNEWGGDTEFVEISAKQKTNLDELLQTIIITAELLELKANPKKRAKAVIVESKLDPQVGAVADILIQEGELKVGDIFVVGESSGKIRTILDDKGNKIKKAGPSTPVEITGFSSVPEAGNVLYCVQNDKQARKIIEDYVTYKKVNEVNGKKHISLESLSKELEDKQLKELKCIIRADSKGSVEALKESLYKLSNEKVSVNIIQSAAGAITEGDIKLAEASNAIIIGFGVSPTTNARRESEKTGVEIRNYNVIYHVIEDIEKAMLGMLDPEYKEIYQGRLEIVQVFKITNVGNIAGSMVVDGKITRNSQIRIIRDGIVIYEGNIMSLKRYKDDVKEATLGQDCGIGIKDFNDLKSGDIIEAFLKEEIKRL